MDYKTPGKEGSDEDVTRESLIAISDSYAGGGVGNLNGRKGKGIDSAAADGDEKFRSELISISSSYSPDGKGSPPSTPPNVNGSMHVKCFVK